MDFLMYFHHKSGRGATLLTPPPPSARFDSYFRPPEGGEVQPGCGPQSGTSQNTDRFLVPGCGECGGWRVRSQVSQALSK